MNVSEDKLIAILNQIREKLEENNLLDDTEDLAISILIGHLEEFKEIEEDDH